MSTLPEIFDLLGNITWMSRNITDLSRDGGPRMGELFTTHGVSEMRKRAEELVKLTSRLEDLLKRDAEIERVRNQPYEDLFTTLIEKLRVCSTIQPLT